MKNSLGPFSSCRNAVEKSCLILACSKSQLSGYLGVTLKTLEEWVVNDQTSDLSKAKRLVRMYFILEYLLEAYPVASNERYKDILLNTRIIYDPDDDEDGMVSLIGLVNSGFDVEEDLKNIKQAIAVYVLETEGSNPKENIEKRDLFQFLKNLKPVLPCGSGRDCADLKTMILRSKKLKNRIDQLNIEYEKSKTKLEKLFLITLLEQKRKAPGICGRAFTKYECIRCEMPKSHPDTCVPEICPECEKELSNGKQD